MIGAAHRYLELVMELLIERARAGGNLQEDEEVAYVDELERCWWAMTNAEQDEAERILSQSSIEAPLELGEKDTTVTPGIKEPPRRKVLEAEAA
jgi:hypothetical protein